MISVTPYPTGVDNAGLASLTDFNDGPRRYARTARVSGHSDL
jgi:hypothetical protein